MSSAGSGDVAGSLFFNPSDPTAGNSQSTSSPGSSASSPAGSPLLAPQSRVPLSNQPEPQSHNQHGVSTFTGSSTGWGYNPSSEPQQQSQTLAATGSSTTEDMFKLLMGNPDLVAKFQSMIASQGSQSLSSSVPVASSSPAYIAPQAPTGAVTTVSSLLGGMKLGNQTTQAPLMSYAQTNNASNAFVPTHTVPTRGVINDVAPRSSFTTFNQKAAVEKGSTFMPPPNLKFKNKVNDQLLTKAPDGSVLFSADMRIDADSDEYNLPDPDLAYSHYVEGRGNPPSFALVCDLEKDISGNVGPKEGGPIYTIKTGLLWYTQECVSTFYIGGCILKHLPEKNQTKKIIGNDRQISYYETYVYIGIPIRLYDWIKRSLAGMGLILDEGEKDIISGDYYYSNYNVTKSRTIQWSMVTEDGNVANESNTGTLKNVMNAMDTNFTCDIYADYNVKRQGIRPDGSVKFTLSPSIKSIQLIDPTKVDPPNPVVTVSAAVDTSRTSAFKDLKDLTKKMNEKIKTSDAIQAAGRMGQRQNASSFTQSYRY